MKLEELCDEIQYRKGVVEAGEEFILKAQMRHTENKRNLEVLLEQYRNGEWEY